MVTETATKQNTDKAISEPARLFGEERHWCDRRSRAEAALAEAVGTAGAVLLDGGDGALRKQATTLAGLRAEIDAADAAIAEARRRRVQAILADWRGEAEGLRGEAREMLTEADARQRKTDRILTVLEEWEGVPYVPVPARQPDHLAFVDALGFRSREGSGGSPEIVYVPTPKTELLRQEAAGMEQQAVLLEDRKVPAGGAIETEDRDELLLLAGSWDFMKIAPPLATVETWLEEAEAPVLERRSRLNTSAVGHGAPLSYRLIWTDGEIDTRRSRVTLPALDD